MRSVCGLGPAVLAAGLVLGCGGAFAASAEKGKAAFIHAYLEAIPKRADYKDIPLLNQ